MFVPSTTALTWVGTFGPGSFDNLSLDDAISQVSSYLKNNYNLLITDYQDDLADDSSAGTVTLSLQTGMDRGNTGADDGVADIKSNVDDAFTNVVRPAYGGIDLQGSTSSLTSVNISSTSGPSYSFSVRNLLPSWLGGATVTPEQQAQYTAQGQQQIDTVATNAAAASGAGSTAAATATQTASDQSQQFAKDEANLANKQNADTAARDRWILIGIIVVVGAVVLIAVRPYVVAAQSV
jgi:hypothetical protein